MAERGDGRLGATVRFVAGVLSGVPSIVVGIVAYGLLVLPMKRFSADSRTIRRATSVM